MLVQTDQDNIVKVIFLQKQFSCAMLSQMFMENIELTILLCNCNAAPVWSTQHCKGYFPPKTIFLCNVVSDVYGKH